jgi:hypothetical protein
MKSIIQEASTLTKAIEQGWIKAGKPNLFSIKIMQEPSKNFIGMTMQTAKIVVFCGRLDDIDTASPQQQPPQQPQTHRQPQAQPQAPKEIQHRPLQPRAPQKNYQRYPQKPQQQAVKQPTAQANKPPIPENKPKQ